MNHWVALALLPLVVYRLTRFALLDSLLETSRDRLFVWLNSRHVASEGWRATFWYKLHDGASCAFCVSVWVSAAALVYWCAFAGEWLGWAWPIVWLAISAGAMAVYRYIDPPE
jgi:hypothetical protein